MKVTKEQLINFVIENGDSFGVTMKGIEFVGVDNVLYHIAHQVDPRTSTFYGDHMCPVEYASDTLAETILCDFFAESWDLVYDQAYIADIKGL